MRSHHLSLSAAARVPVLSTTACALATPQRSSTTAASSAAAARATEAVETAFPSDVPSDTAGASAESPRAPFPSRDGGGSASGTRDRRQGGGGPGAAARYMQAMRVTSPCIFLTPSPSQVTSALFYGGDSRVPGATTAQLASRVMDMTPPEGRQTRTSRALASESASMAIPDGVPRPVRLHGRATVVGSHTRAAPYWRSRLYKPFDQLFHQYIECGFTDIEAMLTHPDAPSPAEVLEQVLVHRVPCALLAERALRSIVVSATVGSGSGATAHERTEPGAAAQALMRVTDKLTQDKSTMLLYNNRTVRVALLEALLVSKLSTQAAAVAEATPIEWLTPQAWHLLVDAAAHGRLTHSTLLWKLLVEAPEAQPAAVVRTAGQDSAVRLPPDEIGYAAAHYIPSANAAGNLDVADNAAPGATGCVRLFDDVEGFRRFAEPLLASRDVGAPRTEQPWTEKEKKWLAMSFLLQARGVVYGLDAKTTAELLLRAGPSTRQQASSLLALHIMRRYVRTCELLAAEANDLQATLTSQIQRMRAWPSKLHDPSSWQTSPRQVHRGEHASSLPQANTPALQPVAAHAATATTTTTALATVFDIAATPGGRPSLAGAAMPHPTPYLAFFRIAREARDLLSLVVEDDPVATSAAAGAERRRAALPMLHWELVWHAFQQLNHHNPRWYTQLAPAEAADLCQDVTEVLCRGADPWLTLNVARAVSSRHIVDGLEMSLWLLHHLDASHHTQEAKAVTRKLFQWLLVDVGIHLHPALYHHLIPAARVLIRLGLHDDLKGFYNAVLDNAYAFSESFRHDFMSVMADLACPACSTLLADHDAYHDRTCPNCLQHIPAKDPATLPSYQLSEQHIARQRERRKAQQRHRRQRTFQSADRLRWAHGGGGGVAQDAAAALFHKEVLAPDAGPAHTQPLLPGVAVAASPSLFPLPQEGGNHRGEMMDPRAALEESYRRLELQRQARAYALAHRGDGLSAESAAMPSSSHEVLQRLNELRQGSPNAYLYGRDGASVATAPVQATSADGPWVCVWCREKNSEWASRLECSACGAETGPTAPWRAFNYATDGDPMTEIRARIANCGERPVEAVTAAYLLMVYRRTFFLRAVPHDHERIHHLIQRLCELHERVLAGFVYTRLVPPPQRRKDDNLMRLTQLFEGSLEACQALTETDLADDEKVLEVVFSKETCRVCFGHHDWKRCPIITRDFSTTASTTSRATGAQSRISLSPEEKQALILKQLHKRIRLAVEEGHADRPKRVVDAYAAFITSPFREVFAEVHAEETNALSITLSHFKQYRRAAFVLCHVPLHARLNEAYLALAQYFNVTEDEAMAMLAKRSPLGHQDSTHPNFVQVTRTCCMCLDERHASFACPRLATWLREAHHLMDITEGPARQQATTAGASPQTGRPSNDGASALVDPVRQFDLQRRLKAQADGWTSAGPERLYAFYRFLLDHVDELRETPDSADTADENGSDSSAYARPRRALRHDGAASFDTPLVYAVNKVVCKLAAAGKDKEAYRLYAHTPAARLAVASTTALLRMQHFSDEHVRDLLYMNESRDGKDSTVAAAAAPLPSLESTTVATTSASARAAAVPLRQRCLLCFDDSHSFMQCPELSAQPSLADRLRHVVRHVGGVACSADGISAAAAYVYHTYNMGQLPHDLLRDHPDLVRALLTLCHRCFATHQVAAGVRVLRRLPIEMVPPVPIYTSLWRAAGLAESEVASRQSAILSLFDAEGLRPSIDSPPERATYSAHLMASLGKLIHDDLCRHCYENGHTLATCSVFHAEVSFGRDYVAAYRMNMMSEQLSTEWQDDYLLKLVDFFETHRLFMPYHIAGVANALSAIAAMWSFRGEPGIALRHLLTIPPAYRRRQAFKHLLHCLQVPSAEISRLLDSIVFVPDNVGTRGGGSGSAAASAATSAFTTGQASSSANVSVAQHLLIPKPAIRDIARVAVFDKVPAAIAALDESDSRAALIAARNKPPHAGTEDTSTDATGRAGTRTRGERVLPARLVMQSGDIRRLREDFDPILSRLEEAVGMKLGSRHILFTSAVDVIDSSGGTPLSAAASVTHASESAARDPVTPREGVATVETVVANTSSAASTAAPPPRREPAAQDDDVRTDVADSAPRRGDARGTPRGTRDSSYQRRGASASGADRPRRDAHPNNQGNRSRDDRHKQRNRGGNRGGQRNPRAPRRRD